MQPRSKRLVRLSVFKRKQLLTNLLSAELNDSGFDISFGFESRFNSRVCTLRFADRKQLVLHMNLDAIDRAFPVADSEQELKLRYCVLFVAAYVKQIAKAKTCMPQSYFEGLTFLNAIETYQSKKAVGVDSPISHWQENPKRGYCIRPLEISSALHALGQMNVSSSLSEQEQQTIANTCDQLRLYASLPEVSYNHARVPMYALTDALKHLSRIIAEAPFVIEEFPILTLAPFEKLQKLTVNELFLHSVQANQVFLTGIAVRIVAFLQPSAHLTDSACNRMTDALQQYIADSLTYYQELKESGRCLQTDNLFAVKIAVRSVNRYLMINGSRVTAGNLHTIM